MSDLSNQVSRSDSPADQTLGRLEKGAVKRSNVCWTRLSATANILRFFVAWSYWCSQHLQILTFDLLAYITSSLWHMYFYNYSCMMLTLSSYLNLPPTRRLCNARRLFVCLSVCLLATLRKSCWTNLREKFTTDVSMDKEKWLNFEVIRFSIAKIIRKVKKWQFTIEEI